MSIRYKNLNLISFVGVDENTNQLKLEELQQETNVALEFGVLFSERRSGGRYSTMEFCHKFLESQLVFDKSLHLCGSEVIDKFLETDPKIIRLCEKADRVQLNFSIKKHDEKKLIEGILNGMNCGVNIILQMNKSKAEFINSITSLDVKDKRFSLLHRKLSLLHDGSGGFGREIKRVDPPRQDYFTGYAGGLKPENVRRVVEMIEEKNTNGLPYYIDMESGIRTDNVFDIAKCAAVLNELSD